MWACSSEEIGCSVIIRQSSVLLPLRSFLAARRMSNCRGPAEVTTSSNPLLPRDGDRALARSEGEGSALLIDLASTLADLLRLLLHTDFDGLLLGDLQLTGVVADILGDLHRAE